MAYYIDLFSPEVKILENFINIFHLLNKGLHIVDRGNQLVIIRLVFLALGHSDDFFFCLLVDLVTSLFHNGVEVFLYEHLGV